MAYNPQFNFNSTDGGQVVGRDLSINGGGNVNIGSQISGFLSGGNIQVAGCVLLIVLLVAVFFIGTIGKWPSMLVVREFVDAKILVVREFFEGKNWRKKA